MHYNIIGLERLEHLINYNIAALERMEHLMHYNNINKTLNSLQYSWIEKGGKLNPS